MVKTTEKAAVLDSDEVCRIQTPWSALDGIWEAWWVLRQLPAGVDGGCRRGGRAAVGVGRLSSPSRDASSPSKANQWSKSLVASGLSTCPYFFQLVVFTCLCFFCLPYLRERCALSWRFDVHKRTSQETNAAQTKAPPAAQKCQATPTHVFPHPPHQGGGSGAEHGALSVSKPQHPGVVGRRNSRLHRK